MVGQDLKRSRLMYTTNEYSASSNQTLQRLNRQLSGTGACRQNIPKPYNLYFCKELNVHHTRPALGRLKKDEVRDKKHNYIDESDRIKVEPKFNLAKRKCGLGLIMTKLPETTRQNISMSIIILNLWKFLSAFFARFDFFF